MNLADDAPGRAEGFVLAGGQSSRMGQEKALMTLAGRPLVAHALGILDEARLTSRIAGAQTQLGAFAPVVKDESPGKGPLAGICAALAATQADLAVFLPVDLPLLPPSLIRYMLQHQSVTNAAVTLASVNGFAETFPAVIRCEALPVLQEALRGGQGGCFAAFQTAAMALGGPFPVLPVELLAQCRHVEHPEGLAPAFWFLNVNTEADLQRAEALLSAKDRVS